MQRETGRKLTASGFSNAATYEKVRRWYLARLRKSALGASADRSLTPARLIAVDRDYVEKMILLHSSTVRKARLRAATYEQVAGKFSGSDLSQSLVKQYTRVLAFVGGIQFLALVLFVAVSGTIAVLPIAAYLLVAFSGIAALYVVGRKRILAQASGIATAFNSAIKKEEEEPKLSGTLEVDVLTAMAHEFSHQLTESQTREEVIADHALDLIFALDEKGRFVSISPSSTRIWGFAPGQLEGKHISVLLYPESTRKIEELLAQKDKTTETAVEVSASKDDGSTVFLAWSMEWSNTENVMFCSARDITLERESERILRQSEANMRALIDTIPIGLVTLDPDGCIDSTNPRTREIFGFEEDELVGAHPQILFGERDVPRDQYVDQLARDTFGKLHEMRVSRKNGELVHIETSCTTMQTPDGERLLVTVLDVSDRQELERLKQRFVALVSHELRTPLTSIQLFLELLADGSLGPISDKIAKRSRGVLDHVKRLLNLVEDLLNVESMASGQFRMKFEEVSIGDVVTRSMAGVDELANQAGVRIEAEGEPLKFVADEDRLVQAVINLVSNAIKFSRRGSLVKIRSGRDGDTIEIQVCDEGAGIAPGVAAGLFQPFKQAPDEAARKNKRGTGLGLYICKVIIEQHGGKVGLHTEEGKGSTFWLRFPAEGSAITVS